MNISWACNIDLLFSLHKVRMLRCMSAKNSVDFKACKWNETYNFPGLQNNIGFNI